MEDLFCAICHRQATITAGDRAVCNGCLLRIVAKARNGWSWYLDAPRPTTWFGTDVSEVAARLFHGITRPEAPVQGPATGPTAREIRNVLNGDPGGTVSADLAVAYIEMGLITDAVPGAVVAVTADPRRLHMFGSVILAHVSQACWERLTDVDME